MTLTHNETAMQIYQILIREAHNHSTLTYTEVTNGLESNIIARRIGRPYLDSIRKYCNKEQLPPIDRLVVRMDTGEPGSGYKIRKNLQQDLEDVFAQDWFALKQPQPADFD